MQLPVSQTTVLIHIRHAFKLLTLIGPHHFTWEMKTITVAKSSSTVEATERYERSVKRKVLADAQSPANVQLKKKIIDKDTDGNTTNGKF